MGYGTSSFKELYWTSKSTQIKAYAAGYTSEEIRKKYMYIEDVDKDGKIRKRAL